MSLTLQSFKFIHVQHVLATAFGKSDSERIFANLSSTPPQNKAMILCSVESAAKLSNHGGVSICLPLH